jgi:hypothetical protein
MSAKRVIRLHAEGGPDQPWEAFCLDFDLAVQGDSLEEVIRDMIGAVDDYVRYVESLPPEEREQFLNRRAPLSLRLKSTWCLLMSVLRRPDRRNGKSRAQVFIPVPA